jgi:hypothetical protein
MQSPRWRLPARQVRRERVREIGHRQAVQPDLTGPVSTVMSSSSPPNSALAKPRISVMSKLTLFWDMPMSSGCSRSSSPRDEVVRHHPASSSTQQDPTGRCGGGFRRQSRTRGRFCREQGRRVRNRLCSAHCTSDQARADPGKRAAYASMHRGRRAAAPHRQSASVR